MSKQSNEELIRLIQAGIDTQENYEKLYKQNRGFIYLVIRKRIQGIYEEEDLMQQAFIALVKAVNYYDCEREAKAFLQILKLCIWNELRDTTSELPASMQNKLYHYKKAYDMLYDELGRKPRNYELMYEMNIDLKQLEEIRKAYQANYPLSLDEPLSDEEGAATRLDLYSEKADESTNFDENIEKEEIKKAVNDAVGKLQDIQRKVIQDRYFRNRTLESIAQENNISKQYVRSQEEKALRELRKSRGLNKVVDYTSINEYKNVGVDRFNNTWTSSTEWVVIEREKKREEEERRFNKTLEMIKEFEKRNIQSLTPF